MKPYYAERRAVLRALARQLEEALRDDDAWLFRDDAPGAAPGAELRGDPTDPRRRRRVEAAREIARDFRKRGAEPPPPPHEDASPPAATEDRRAGP